MKRLVAVLALSMAAQSAHAVHIYAGYTCTAGKLALNYDGPGSNYAVGGYSHFYTMKEKVLAYEESIDDSSSIGEQVGDFGTLEVLFETTGSKIVTEPVVTPVDPKTCEGFDYEHSEWKSERVITIKEISAEASKKLGLKAGSVITMSCDEDMDEPVRCDNE